MLELKFSYNMAMDRYDFYIFERDANGIVTHVGETINPVMRSVSKYECINSATFTLPAMEAEKILGNLNNELAKNGYKPDTQSKVEGVLEATKTHLEDMRHLVFGKGITNGS